MTVNAIVPNTDNLSDRLRTETIDAHERAEHSRYITDLMGGKLPVASYAALAVAHHGIYTALEEAVDANTDPSLTALLDPALARVPSLERDLAFLLGDDWADRLDYTPATQRYIEHLRTAATESSAVLLAHHYVRLLGDLSGGQVIYRILTRVYGFDDERGTEFYRFSELDSPKAYKDRYRELLDELDWSDAHRDALLAEVNEAYRFNQAVFEDLGELVTSGG